MKSLGKLDLGPLDIFSLFDQKPMIRSMPVKCKRIVLKYQCFNLENDSSWKRIQNVSGSNGH